MTSTREYKYTMVAYERYSNAIMVDPTKSKEGIELTISYKAKKKTLKYRRLKQKIHILDNECSNTLRFLVEEEEEHLQLIPLEINRINT